jgi:predicted PurR-regulated permease PerM
MVALKRVLCHVDMVPFVGTAGVWVPGTVYLLATGAWPATAD